MPHAFVVQQRRSHIAAVQGEGASERGGVLEGLRGALAKCGKHRVRRVPEQYFWHHQRWRRQPPDTPPELRDPTR